MHWLRIPTQVSEHEFVNGIRISTFGFYNGGACEFGFQLLPSGTLKKSLGFDATILRLGF